MQALHQNLLAALATVVYVKAVVGSCDLAVARGWLSSPVSRKIVHVAAGSWLIFWPLFVVDDQDPYGSWRLNILVPAVYSVQLLAKGALLRDPNDPDVQTMTRTGNPSELLGGPLLFTLAMNAVGLYLFRTEAGVLVMACLGFGDGIAPLAGRYLQGFGAYPTYPFGKGDTKTLAGSLGFVGASLVGYYTLLFATGISSHAGPKDVLRIAVMAAITEGLTGQFDNPCVALVAYAASQQYI